MAITPVCKASSPPVSSKTIATAPCINDQRTRCQTGVLSPSVPAVIVFITNEPESEEVIKKENTKIIAKMEEYLTKGKFSKNTNSEEVRSSCTACNMVVSPAIIISNALPPKAFIQKITISEGTNTTPNTNSLTVRPLDICAINVPTNGDQAIHHPQ